MGPTVHEKARQDRRAFVDAQSGLVHLVAAIVVAGLLCNQCFRGQEDKRRRLHFAGQTGSPWWGRLRQRQSVFVGVGSCVVAISAFTAAHVFQNDGGLSTGIGYDLAKRASMALFTMLTPNCCASANCRESSTAPARMRQHHRQAGCLLRRLHG